MLRNVTLVFIIILSSLQCSQTVMKDQDDDAISYGDQEAKTIIKGISLVAPPSPFKDNPMTSIQQVNADWIAVIPYAGYNLGATNLLYNTKGQWWGEGPEGITETVRLAKETGLKVLLKPQIWVPGSWTGGIDFKTEKEWQAWEKSYAEYLMFYVNLTKEMDIDMICIGTEIKASEIKRAKSWRNLIQEVKKIYKGKLTYASNWDSYAVLPFWDDLDYIGVDAYFPLDESKNPSPKILKQKWNVIHKDFKKLYAKFKKPILFTEFGYLSVDGCAGKTWELEKQSRTLPSNEKAQAIALEALFDFFDDQPYWGGGFLWKWYPVLGVHQDHGNNGHTPQGKLAEETVREWYGKM